MNQKKPPVSRVSCASPNRSLKRRLMPPCGVVPRCGISQRLFYVAVSPQLARVLTIGRLLRASLPWGALPDSMMLASSSGFSVGARGNSLRSDKSARLSRPPCRCSARDKGEKPDPQQIDQAPLRGATRGLPLCGKSLTLILMRVRLKGICAEMESIYFNYLKIIIIV